MNYKSLLVLVFILVCDRGWADFGDLPCSSRVGELETKVDHSDEEIRRMSSRLDRIQLDLVNSKQELLGEYRKLFGQLSDLQRQILQLNLSRRKHDRESLPSPNVVYHSENVGAGNSKYVGAKSDGGVGSSLGLDEYEEALKTLRAGHYREALTLFQELKSKAPLKLPLQGDLSYWIGTAYYLLGDYRNAIEFFTQVYELWPRNDHASDALFNIINSYYQTDQRSAAKSAEEILLKNYPRSSAAKSLSKSTY